MHGYVTKILPPFRICLYGGKEVHEVVMSSIQDLADVFSNYKDEVLVYQASVSFSYLSLSINLSVQLLSMVLIQAKREELLEFAQVAISGLKLNADILRFDQLSVIDYF
jgi:hypothetical protein